MKIHASTTILALLLLSLLSSTGLIVSETIAPLPYAAYFDRADQVVIAYCVSTEPAEESEPDEHGVLVTRHTAKLKISAYLKDTSPWKDPELDFHEVEIVDNEKFQRSDPETGQMLFELAKGGSSFKAGSSYLIFLTSGSSLAFIEVPTYNRP